MSELLGFTSILFVTIYTYFLILKKKELNQILFVALTIRIFVILIGNYFISLPDSTGDARSYEYDAWIMSQYGFVEVLSFYPGPSSAFLTWIIAIIYSLTDRSIIMAQSLSLFFGITSIYLGCVIAEKIWNIKSSIKVGWVLALFPTLILYSCLTMREAYVWFFFLVALLGILNWYNSRTLKYLIFVFIGFLGATFFHGGMFIGALVFLILVGAQFFGDMIGSLKFGRINIKSFFFVFFMIFFLGYFASGKISLPKIGNFNEMFEMKRIIIKTSKSQSGEASYPEWLTVNKPTELVYKTPLRAIYFLFAPFPWDVSKKSHLIGMFDGFFYLSMIFLILKNIKTILRNPVLKLILIILICYFLVFGIGVGNFGTGLRHRAKFVIALIILASPFLPRLIFFKKKIR